MSITFSSYVVGYTSDNTTCISTPIFSIKYNSGCDNLYCTDSNTITSGSISSEYLSTSCINISLDTIANEYYWSSIPVAIDPKSKIAEIIKSRIAPQLIIKSHSDILKPPDTREKRARDTLRRMIGEKEWRRLCVRGFISVEAQSGRIYCISPGHTLADVWENGKLIDKLCVQLSGGYTPTDSLIMRYLIIRNDEQLFISKAIKHYGNSPSHITRVQKPDHRPLVEAIKHLRLAA